MRERERDAKWNSIYRKKWDGRVINLWLRKREKEKERKRDIPVPEAHYNCHKNIIKEKHIEILSPYTVEKTLTQFSRGMFHPPPPPFFSPTDLIFSDFSECSNCVLPFSTFYFVTWENGGSFRTDWFMRFFFTIGQHLNVKCVSPHLFSPVRPFLTS